VVGNISPPTLALKTAIYLRDCAATTTKNQALSALIFSIAPYLSDDPKFFVLAVLFFTS
jgi:hypothetical protein